MGDARRRLAAGRWGGKGKGAGIRVLGDARDVLAASLIVFAVFVCDLYISLEGGVFFRAQVARFPRRL